MEVVSEHDVIVVGGGPSGAAAAAALAQQGHDVLLMDRHSFPRDKICGDAVGVGVIRHLFQLGMQDKVHAAVERGEFYKLDSLRLVSPKGYVMRAPFEPTEGDEASYVAPRVYFDAVVFQHALDSGAQFLRAEVKEPLIEDGRVVGVLARENGDTHAYRSRVVVGADGVTSVIMRHLRPEQGQHTDMHRAVALRAYSDDIEIYPNEVEFYLYDEILPGYAWIFPTGERSANIGLGMRLDIFRGAKHNLKKMLQDFLNMPAIRERLRNDGAVHDVATWQLNFGSQKNLQHAFDGALLVGDAAGFINPLTGGGIYNGLISALLAADTIDEALKRGDTSREFLKVYEKRCDDEMWSGMQWSFRYQRLLMRHPHVVDFLIKHLGGRTGIAKIFLSKL